MLAFGHSNLSAFAIHNKTCIGRLFFRTWPKYPRYRKSLYSRWFPTGSLPNIGGLGSVVLRQRGHVTLPMCQPSEQFFDAAKIQNARIRHPLASG